MRYASQTIRHLLWLAGLLLAIGAAAVSAGVPPGLYQVAVPVADQSPDSLKQAARTGMATVLARLSGQAALGEYPGVQPFLAQADRFVSQFSYETVPPVAGAPAGQPPSFRLLLQFTPDEMERVLHSSGLPLWPLNRPPVLVWSVIQGPGAPRLMTPEQDAAWFETLNRVAADHGVLLQWPLLDMDDQLAADPAALWALDENAIRRVSERYGNAYKVAGRFSRTSSGQWVGHWLVLSDAAPQVLEVQADSADAAAGVLATQLMKTLSSRYAIAAAASASGSTRIAVDRVGTFSAYMQSRAFLASLGSVQSVVPEDVQGDRVVYRVILVTDPAAFLDELRLHSELEAAAIPAGVQKTAGGEGQDPLLFHWRKP